MTRQAFLWGIFSLLLFSLAHLGIQSSDDAATLATASALWDRHTLAIPGMAWLDERVDIGQRHPNGTLYSKYGLGQVVTAAALYGVGDVLFPQSEAFQWAGYPIAESQAGAIVAQYTNVFLGAILVSLVTYAIGEQQPGTPLHHQEAIVWAGIMLTLASPLWHAARGFGTEVGAALGLLGAVLLVKRARAATSRTPLWLSVMGLGIAALFRPSALVFGAAWIAWLWDRPRRDWITVGIAMGAVLLVLAGYNWIRYSDCLEFGYGDDGARFALQIVGLVGYLVAPGRGLLIFAPWALLLIPQAIHAFRARDADNMGAILGIACFYVFHAMWRDWEGGFAFGPRLLIPVLPIIALIVAGALPKLLYRGLRPLSVLFALPASLMQMAALAGDPIETYMHIRGSGLSFTQTVWGLRENIAIQQLKVAATPEHGIWLFLWSVVMLAWIGYCYAANPDEEKGKP
jgi:hypothetical protein